MSGLILSDILTLKKTAKLYLLVTALYAAVGIISGGGVNMISFIIFFGVMLVLVSFSYNDLCHWDRYVNTAPIRRFDVVLSKYIFALGILVVTFVLGAAFLFIADTLQGRMPAEDILVLAVVAVVGHVYMMLMLPILFKFTVDRARIILVIIFLIPFGVIMLVSKTVPAQTISRFAELFAGPWLVPAAVLGVIILTIISFILSLGIYKNKEF